MYKQIPTRKDLAQRSVMHFLPPGGKHNGVWADTWVILADVETRYVAAILGLMAENDVGSYAVASRADGDHRLYVDSMRYHSADDVLIGFLRAKQPRSETAPIPVPRRSSKERTRESRSPAPAAVTSWRFMKSALRWALWVPIGAALIALALSDAYHNGPNRVPTAHPCRHYGLAEPPRHSLLRPVYPGPVGPPALCSEPAVGDHPGAWGASGALGPPVAMASCPSMPSSSHAVLCRGVATPASVVPIFGSCWKTNLADMSAASSIPL